MADTWTAISGYTPQDYTDTAVFEVDSDTKKIALITGQALVAGEENSQYIKFVLDRYWDGIDIKDKAFYIEYALAGQYYGKTAAVNAEYTTEQIRFGWVVPQEACCISGTLLFVLRIESADYVLKTQIAEHSVFKSVNVEDVVPEPTKEAWYRDFEARVETAISDAEAALTAAQTAQGVAENAAQNAQTAEANAEAAAQLAQTAAQDAQNAQGAVDSASQAAQTAAQTAQVSQESAEASAQTAEAARDDALTAQAVAETAQTGAESAQSAAEDARDSAQAYAEQANQRNNIAAGYATGNKALTTDYTIVPMGADYVLGSNFTRASDGGYRAGKAGTVMVSAGCNMDGFTSGDTIMACIGKYNNGWQFTSVGHFPSIIRTEGSCDIVSHIIIVNQGDVIYLRARNATAARGNVTSARLVVQYI